MANTDQDTQMLLLAEAAELISDRCLAGAIWLDASQIVSHVLGSIANFAAIGAPITDSLLVLIGQEDRLAAMQNTPHVHLTIGNIAMMGPENNDGSVRMNVDVSWQPAQRHYVVLLTRVLSSEIHDLVLEDEIRKRRIADAELARINERLEEFAYVISHDLKAPLRALRYLSDDMRSDLSSSAPNLDSAREAASGIQLHTRRMSNMLDGLLDYSRIGRGREALQDVDTAALIEAIAASIHRPATMTIEITGNWPMLRTLAVPLDVVLRNLIENAIKHHDRDQGRITVTASGTATAIQFAVADDGPGIPPEWQEAIFEPFRRIHDTAESSGIGLSLVKRTIETAGGRIDVISDPAKIRGTTFQVIWPRHHPA
jgi:signal transduction histidine kinase